MTNAKTNFNGTCFETYTWAAGLAAATRQVGVFSTSHIPTVHPMVAAQQATTMFLNFSAMHH